MNGLALRPPSTYVSVCSGVGGLDLGLHAAIPGLEPVVYIEREAHAASVLVARMEEKALPQAPVWDDVCTFDARPLVGLVDLVAGGTPCPEFSLANPKRKLDPDEQLATERGSLFRQQVRIAVECEAPFLFWENVAGATGAVPAVADHLHASGYESIVWTVVRARDVGFFNNRERVFLLAYSSRQGLEGPQALGCDSRAREVDAAQPGRLEVVSSPPGRHDVSAWRARRQRGQVLPLAPHSRVHRGTHGMAAPVDVCVCPREDRLRAAGNGVVPQQAALAWRILWAGLCERLIGGQRP